MSYIPNCSTCAFHTYFGERKWVCSNDESIVFANETTADSCCTEYVMRCELRGKTETSNEQE